MKMGRPLTPLLVITLGLSVSLVSSQSRLDCRTDTLNTCIKLADPLLEDPRYVFPANTEDINHVCNVLFPKTWSEFVSCIKRYTSDCLTADQRADFNRAVGDSINSVHKMCTNEDYKSDYLLHASCIKEKSTSSVYCGSHYSRLVDQVKGVQPASQRELCCSHASFKDCVIHETASCSYDSSSNGMSAQQFARAMLDKSLGFLLKQCQDYVPSQNDCPGFQRPAPKQPRFNDELVGVTEENKYGGGMYFPSGAPNREERRQDDGWTGLNGDQQNGESSMIGSRDDGWTGLNGDKINDNNPQAREEDRPITPRDIQRELPEEREPITEGNFLLPVRTPVPNFEDERTRRPSFEDERTRRPSFEDQRTRRPWLPNMDTDIKSFDDLFSNAIDDTLAQGRTSGGNINFLNSFMAVFTVIAAIIVRAY